MIKPKKADNSVSHSDCDCLLLNNRGMDFAPTYMIDLKHRGACPSYIMEAAQHD